MTCSRTSGVASGTNFRSSCTVAQSAIWGQACPVQLTGASIFWGPSPQRRSGSRLVRRWRRVFDDMGTWQGAVTPGMPGGGPRYREAMALVGSPSLLLQDSGLRPRVEKGPGTTPKMSAAPWASACANQRSASVKKCG